MITAGIIAWTLIAHSLVPDPRSAIHSLGAFTFFNLLHFACIFLGLKAFEREQGTKPTFKAGVKQGVLISVVYAVTASLFFAITLLVIGTKWMAAEATSPNEPMSLVALKAFAGLTLFTIFLGLIYSTLISFFLAKRLSSDLGVR
jgi:hypothetical protein